MANTPRDDRFPFLPADDRVIARTRRDPSSVPTIVGYESQTSEDPIPVTGDDTSIFARALGRASSDGTTGAVAVQDGEPQILLVDQYGRPWVNVAPGSVQNVQGNIAHDDLDLNSFPVKIGGRAVANGTAPAAVAANDRVNAAYALQGAAHVLTSPNPLTDATTYVYTVLPATVGNATGQLVVKATPGRVRRILVANNAGITLYAQIHNTAAVGTIATGTMITPGLPIPAGGFGFFDFSEADLACAVGIAVALSTTQTTYTAAAVTGQFSGQYA